MNEPRVFARYDLALTALSLALVLLGTFLLSRPVLLSLAFFLLARAAVEISQVVLSSGLGLSVGSALALSAMWWLGVPAGLVLQGAGTLLVGLLQRARPDRIRVNFFLSVLPVAFAGFVLSQLAGVGWLHGLGLLRLGAGVTAYCLLQVLLNVVTFSLYKGRPLRSCLEDVWGRPVVIEALVAAAAVPLVLAIQTFGLLPSLAVVVAVSLAALGYLRRAVRRSQQRVLGDLVAPAVDARPEHPEAASRVDELVRAVSAVGEAAGLGPDDLDALRWAALLHDTGLTEAAAEAAASVEPLTDDQLRQIREHPLRASMRVGQIGNLLWVARILETHHEHYNGWGYPFGLRGEDIPLPAAILGLVEAYLALTSVRPYRPQVATPEEALRRVKTLAGEQFHPAAVAALERALASGALSADGRVPSSQVLAEAIARLRRVVETPGLSRHRGLAVAGSDIWLKGTGGLGRFLQRLFARDPLKVTHIERPLAAEWYRSLFDLGRVFSASLDPGVIARQLAGAVHHLTTLPCVIHLVQEGGQVLATAASSGYPAGALPEPVQSVHEGLMGLAFSEKRPVTSVDVSRDPRAVFQERAEEVGLKSFLAVPLVVSEMPLGIIAVHSPTERRFHPSEVQALTALGNLAALALHNAFLYRKASDRLEQLVRTQLSLRAVLDTVPDGILALTKDGVLSLSNRRANEYLRALGLDPAGGGPADLVRGLEDRLGAAAPRKALAVARTQGPDTVSAKLPSGERFFEVWASPLEDAAGTVTGVLVVLSDVTEAKRLETEVRRNEKLAAVGEVAARAAHEIKNPLASLQGFAQLMELYCPVREQWEECSKYVRHISSELERLMEITQSMLTLARPTIPKLVLADLAGPVAETVAALSGKASAQGTVLKGPDEKSAVVLHHDPRLVRQVALNLIQNALDAVSGPGGPPPGSRRVTVTVGFTRREGKRYAFVQVRDNGPGVRPDDRTRLFTPFFTTKETGTGLGLAVSRGIAEAHGGVLQARRGRGNQTVFEVLLSVDATAAAAAEQERTTTGAGVAPAGGQASGPATNMTADGLS